LTVYLATVSLVVSSYSACFSVFPFFHFSVCPFYQFVLAVFVPTVSRYRLCILGAALREQSFLKSRARL